MGWGAWEFKLRHRSNMTNWITFGIAKGAAAAGFVHDGDGAEGMTRESLPGALLQGAKGVKKPHVLLVGLLLVACTNQRTPKDGAIVLGVIRSWLNRPDTYVVGANGVGSIKVRLPGKLGSEPEWSPDGKWIVSSTQDQVIRTQDSTIYMMRSDGSRRESVIHNQWGSYDPSWSPDGTRITYRGYDNRAGIFILDVQCFQHDDRNCNPTPTFLAPGDGAPDWSPDGRKIVYEMKGNIFVVDSDGNGRPENLTPDGSDCYRPKWSPDGIKIAFDCLQGEHLDVFVLDANGLNLTDLTNGVGANTHPKWSPNGSKIAFRSSRGGLGKIIGTEDTIRSNAIFLINSDGSNVVRLSLRDDEDVLWFTWLPQDMNEAGP